MKVENYEGKINKHENPFQIALRRCTRIIITMHSAVPVLIPDPVPYGTYGTHIHPHHTHVLYIKNTYRISVTLLQDRPSSAHVSTTTPLVSALKKYYINT
jgi:hypothetical protein